TVAAGGHVTAVRDPVLFNRCVRDFVAGTPRRSTWTRAMSRKRKALFVSSPIGLGHVQRDLAIARELRELEPELDIDWFTTDPARRYLETEGERLHPITQRLASESGHFESVAGEHDLHAFFALRSMDEVMVRNFMVFHDLMEREHYDLVIGDEAWEVDYYYHENPELKRQPFVFLTDFVGCLPMGDDEREALLCADRNADDIEHLARFPYVRDASIFVGNPDDVTELPFGPGMPRIRDWTDRNFCYAGYTLPFDPASLADVERTRARLGYRRDERIVIASVGGTGVGRHLLDGIAQSFIHMKRQAPELRMILVAGPRVPVDSFPRLDGLEVRPYVHKLFEHLSCCDLALVQGGLSTCMELVAARRPFLGFPLQRHFEQCVHVRKRLRNYDADRSVDYPSLTPEALAGKALAAMNEPVRYRPVETDGAARAARRIAEMLDNRWWVDR
ncbi:MAG TPA: glycosyltransferase, partial [Burkholderiaceae bacterium]|nr:glycosyltransferase [Burkholderiaceae bacterium]